jgi:hypothetical protein
MDLDAGDGGLRPVGLWRRWRGRWLRVDTDPDPNPDAHTYTHANISDHLSSNHSDHRLHGTRL